MLINKDEALAAIEKTEVNEDVLLQGLTVELCRRQVEMVPETKAVDVVRCVDCVHCKLYRRGTDFYCEEFGMDFYAARYDVNTWYCGDGERRPAE